MGKILVVDDEPELVRFVRRALEADGHHVSVAYDGADGLTQAIDSRPDLVVLDLLMPGVDGTAVLHGLLAVAPNARVLILSAAADVQARVATLEAGAVDFLAKPFAIRELLARVRCQLRRQSSALTPDVISAGGLDLDVHARTLNIDGRVVALSHREFLLLLHLMRRAGDVCSREEILSEVWGYTFDPTTNIVDVYVGRLRRKTSTGVIRTVRNVGYQLQTS